MKGGVEARVQFVSSPEPVLLQPPASCSRRWSRRPYCCASTTQSRSLQCSRKSC